jgi:hypothetical protein
MKGAEAAVTGDIRERGPIVRLVLMEWNAKVAQHTGCAHLQLVAHGLR